MSIGYYCKPCGEMLTEEHAECPFCMNPATPLDECISVSAAWHDPDCEWHHEQVAAECSCPTIGRRMRDATEIEADRAIEVLEKAIEAARNSNQAGENAVVRAARAISR